MEFLTGTQLFSGGVYSLLMVGFGAWLGRSVSREPRTAPPRSGMSEADLLAMERRYEMRRRLELTEYQEANEALRQQIRDVKALAERQRPSLAGPMHAALDQLLAKTEAISHRVASIRNSDGPTLAKVADRPPVKNVGLTPDEVSMIAGQPREPESERVESAPRYSYTRRQLLAPWAIDAPFPADHEFQVVRCKDISAGGLSFFLPERPDFDTFIISVGEPERPVFMAGEVLHSRAATLYGDVGYLVGCKFVQRIELPCSAHLSIPQYAECT